MSIEMMPDFGECTCEDKSCKSCIDHNDWLLKALAGSTTSVVLMSAATFEKTYAFKRPPEQEASE